MNQFKIFVPILLLAVSFSGGSWAAVPTKMAVISKSILKGDGAVQGGQAGGVYSLLDLKKFTHKTAKSERLVIEIGDGSMQKLQGRLGYYTVELQKGRKLILNFSQAVNTALNEKNLASKLASSPFVKKSELRFDRVGQSTSLILDLKKNTQVRVASVRGGVQTGRLVLDLYEDHR